MTKRYTGGVISSSLPTVNAAGASGVFLLSQQADYQSRNSWPPFKVEESLRFRSSASATLSRTPSVTSNRKTWTASLWFKRGTLGVAQILLGALGSSRATYINLNASNQLQIYSITSAGGGDGGEYVTTQVFRDPAAWYHIVVAYDSTQATSTNRIKLWVNGQQVTAFATSTAPTLNHDTQFNWTGATMNIGSYNSAFYIDGYMADINFVDGQQLEASSFGATDKDGNWSPIAYTGTYGTNGFYVNFRDNTSATTMGSDYSGNGNNWTLNNFNVSTANTTYDIMIDVPEDQSDGTANNRGNYCTLNPLNLPKGGSLSNGNLLWTSPTAEGQAVGTMYVSSGKWYWEMVQNVSGGAAFGIAKDTTDINNINLTAGAYTYYTNGNKYDASTGSSYGATFTNGDVIGVALDMDAGTLAFYKNGSSQGTAFTGLSGNFTSLIYDGTSAASPTFTANFGQRPFTYTPPSGFKSLNTFNLPEPTIKQPNKHFDATTYTGTGATLSVTNAGSFQPDFVWLKSRSATTNHQAFDTVRGATKVLVINSTESESTSANTLTAFNSNGFTVSTNTAINTSSATYVAWQWWAGGSTVTNTSGSISAQVRANPTAGFSVVTYTGNGTIGATVGHGLGVAPSMFIVKQRSSAGESWATYHISLGATKYLDLNGTAAASTSISRWNNTAPTTTVFSLYNDVATNGNSSTYVAYCWTPIAGYSAFGSYTGNGSTDGPFVYTGFRPRFVIIKSSTFAGADWTMYDSARNTYNALTSELVPNNTTSENNYSGAARMDFSSNGIKLRTAGAGVNNSGSTYIYMAFAEAPFKYARSR